MSWSSDANPGDFLTIFSTRTIAEIQKNTIKRGKRNPISRRYRTKDDKEAIAAWKLELDGILHVFNVRATASGTHQDPTNKPVVVPDIRRNESKSRVVGSQNQPVSTTGALLLTEQMLTAT